MHIDLRMVDVSDFVIAYCPTSVYSVGTPHEIVVARQQHKPVLLVSPPISYSALEALRSRFAEASDEAGAKLLEELEAQVPIKPNPQGVPSLWYMPLLGGESFFAGFGFDEWREEFGWPIGPLDEREKQSLPKRPLLRFLADLNERLPQRWSKSHGKYMPDDDWLLLDIERVEQEESD